MALSPRVQFRYFWPGFRAEKFFGPALGNLQLRNSRDADYVIFSCFVPRGERCRPDVAPGPVRVFYTGENVVPDMTKCEFALSFCYPEQIRSERHFRLPLYGLRLWEFGHEAQDLLVPAGEIEQETRRKSRFCNFIFSNPTCAVRNEFFHLLAQYRRVDALGRLFQNSTRRLTPLLGRLRSRFGRERAEHHLKIKIMRRYKFSIAFENASAPGYTTEKLVEARLARTVPIYWGNPLVHRDFNPAAFISFYDHGCSLERLVERVIEVDRDERLYQQYLAAPLFDPRRTPDVLKRSYVQSVFARIFDPAGLAHFHERRLCA